MVLQMRWVGHPSGWRYSVAIVAQLLSYVQLFATPWTAACQASLSFTVSWSLLSFMPIESVMLSNHLILCCPFLLLPSIFPSIRVFSNESSLCIRWQRYWSFSFSISPSNEYSGLISFWMNWLDLLVVQFHVSTWNCTFDVIIINQFSFCFVIPIQRYYLICAFKEV